MGITNRQFKNKSNRKTNPESNHRRAAVKTQFDSIFRKITLFV